jgi:hypothetical protein
VAKQGDVSTFARRLGDGRIASSGLGAVRRLADDFDIYSQPGKGTVMLARMRRAGEWPTTTLEVGGVSVAMTGETVCGDAGWSPAIAAHDHRLIDGLGMVHASDAASTAVRALSSQTFSTSVGAHHGASRSRHTRGAPAVTFVDPGRPSSRSPVSATSRRRLSAMRPSVRPFRWVVFWDTESVSFASISIRG